MLERGEHNLVGVGRIFGQGSAHGCFRRHGAALSLRGPASPVTTYQEQEVPGSHALVLSVLGPPGTSIYDVVSSHPRKVRKRAATVPLATTVDRGRLYERADAGPHPVVLQPQHEAFFSIGTDTAFQGGLHPFTVVLPGTHIPKTLSINLLASRPPGRDIPVGITAITASPRS